MRMLFRFSCVMVVFLMAGCAGAPKKKVYISRPEIQTVSNEAFDARIKSLKLNNPYYVAFQLEVINKTAKPLAIDWNKTRYRHNGKDLGRFVFKGIDPESIKAGIPKEMIPAGQTLSKRIHPIKTLGFMRRKDIPKAGQSNFFPGILPNGKNSVFLVIGQDERNWEADLTVGFASKEVP